MRRFIVRPYLGHDCDSVGGFNNGHYLDEIEVEATDENQAIELAMEQFETENDVSNWDKDGFFGEGTFYLESVHTDANGVELDPTECGESDDFYTYQYFDFNEVTEVQIEATV